MILIACAPPAPAQEAAPISTPDRLAWFTDAKLGIFIHWGIYAVDGIGESWSFHNGHVPYDEYMQQLDGFTASKWDPAAWADLIRRCGARYAVMTAKHHDGVALWPSGHTELNVVERTPAGRDLVGLYAEALRKAGLKVGLYYSLIDWSDPNYPGFLRDAPRYRIVDDPARWAAFSAANHAQIRELSGRYRPDLVWFDGDWEHSAEEWDAAGIRELLLEDNPQVIINSRLQGYGDYATPEQGVPVHRPDDPYWELCLTTNTSWGYQPQDTDYKSVNQVIRLLVDCVALGGNLLLDIGPREDGTVPAEQVAILEGLGEWVHTHAEAVYGTRAGIPKDYFYGPSAVSADGRTLYLYLAGRPNGPVMVKGLVNGVERIRVVGPETGPGPTWDVQMKLPWSAAPGIVYIDVPPGALDADVTVLALELDGELELWDDR